MFWNGSVETFHKLTALLYNMPFLMEQSLGSQILFLFVLAIPVACISWTVTHEEIFREFHDYCVQKSHSCQKSYQRKVFYLFTCEYCFSHYVAVWILVITHYHLLFDSWQGYLIAGLSLVWIANVYMAIFVRLRLDIKSQKLEIEQEELQLKETTSAVS